MIAVEASDRAIVPDEPCFRWMVHHVKEGFLALLPAKFVLDGSSKVQITCGPRDGEPQYLQVLGTTNFFVAAFDFSVYYRLLPRQRDEHVLGVICESFCDIGRRHGRGSEIEAAVNRAADTLQGCDFDLRIPRPKLSRVTPCRHFRVTIHRCLNREVGESWLCEVLDKGRRVIHSDWLRKPPEYLDRTDFYKSSEWKGDVLQVRTNYGKVVYELDIGQLRQKPG